MVFSPQIAPLERFALAGRFEVRWPVQETGKIALFPLPPCPVDARRIEKRNEARGLGLQPYSVDRAGFAAMFRRELPGPKTPNMCR
jgi:hypothetical protein